MKTPTHNAPVDVDDEATVGALLAPDLLEMSRRGRQVHDRHVPRVGHGDDGRHDACAVAEPLKDAQGPLEHLCDLDEKRADR